MRMSTCLATGFACVMTGVVTQAQANNRWWAPPEMPPATCIESITKQTNGSPIAVGCDHAIYIGTAGNVNWLKMLGSATTVTLDSTLNPWFTDANDNVYAWNSAAEGAFKIFSNNVSQLAMGDPWDARCHGPPLRGPAIFGIGGDNNVWYNIGNVYLINPKTPQYSVCNDKWVSTPVLPTGENVLSIAMFTVSAQAQTCSDAATHMPVALGAGTGRIYGYVRQTDGTCNWTFLNGTGKTLAEALANGNFVIGQDGNVWQYPANGGNWQNVTLGILPQSGSALIGLGFGNGALFGIDAGNIPWAWGATNPLN